jgi:hypothetical protein
VFETTGYKSDATKFYVDHDGSAAQQYKYETPIKTGSALNVVGRGGNNANNSDKRSQTSYEKKSYEVDRVQFEQKGDMKEEIEWVTCCGACSNKDIHRTK